jgi:glycosyltransferase involved in cell wall biosynthesis
MRKHVFPFFINKNGLGEYFYLQCGMFVSIMIPVYNERPYLRKCLESILNNKLDFKKAEILIADGMSIDGTRDILKEYSKKYKFIKVIDNRKRYQAAGLNLAIKMAKGEILVRCDAHCEYPVNYISELVRYHKKNIADNIGGGIISSPSITGSKPEAIAVALNSKLAVGISYRTLKSNKPIYLETVIYGSFKKELFDKVGLYDESFKIGEDLDLNLRITGSGGKIAMLPWLKIKYYQRSNFKSLAKMFSRYGFWKNKVNKKHKKLSSVRQLFPPLFVIYNLLLIILLFISLKVFLFLLPLLILYILLLLTDAAQKTFKNKKKPLFFIYYIISVINIHYSYGLGYIAGAIRSLFFK